MEYAGKAQKHSLMMVVLIIGHKEGIVMTALRTTQIMTHIALLPIKPIMWVFHFDLYHKNDDPSAVFTVWRGISNNKNTIESDAVTWSDPSGTTKLCRMYVKLQRDNNMSPLIRYLGT